MHIKKKIVSLMLAAVLILTMCPYEGFNIASAATKDVHQSRYLADIFEFPVSYQAGLTRIKAIYPNAKFIYYDVDLDWHNDVLTKTNEMRYGRNLIPSSSPSSWKSTDSQAYNPITNTYTEVEPGWNCASKEIVEYYMDPRNFFNEQDIFQFMDLSFTGSESVDGVQAILSGSFMANGVIADNDGNQISYAQALYDIGAEIGISPYLLACRIRQEQGSGNSSLISGTYSLVPGYYNYFNIGANGSTTDAIITNGLNCAKSHGWDTRYKAIYGGAKILASNYVDAGKNCLYLQHFNMTANENNTVDYSIYMANTTAPYYENKMMVESITNKEAPYTFIIPVYDNMPESPCEMPGGNGNGAHLIKSLSLNGGDISIGKFSTYDYQYTASVDSLSYVLLNIDLFSNKSKLAINGIEVDTMDKKDINKAIMLSPGFNDIVITVTAENGLCRDYVIEIINNDNQPHYRSSSIALDTPTTTIKTAKTVGQIKSEIQMLNCTALVVSENSTVKDNSEMCISGDSLIFRNINNEIIHQTKLILLGDVTNDGLLTSDDINKIQNHLLEIETLTFDEIKTADINQDGTIDIKDLGQLKILISDNLANYRSVIKLTPIINNQLFIDKSYQVFINTIDSTCFIDGYLTYNEGQVIATNAINDGAIHFISDGKSVVFENGLDYVEIQPLIPYGIITVNIEIVNAYDYLTEKEITPNIEPLLTEIKSSEIEVQVEMKDSAIKGDKNHYAADLTIKNVSSKSVAILNFNLGNYLVDKNGQNAVNLIGLQPNEQYTLQLYLVDGLDSSVYQTSIDVQYQDSNANINLMSIPISFDVQSHKHEISWTKNETTHSMQCNECGDCVNEIHKYMRNDNNIYSCLVCDYKASYNLSVIQNVGFVSQKSTFLPSVFCNNKSVNLKDADIAWYVDGKKVSDKNEYTTIFNSAGRRNITCVVMINQEIILTETVSVDITKQTNNNKFPITVQSVSCNSIIMEQHNGYEYKINNGQWQDSNVFSNLQCGKDYVIYQRQKNTKVYSSIKVITSHQYQSVNIVRTCGKNISQIAECLNCKKQVSFEMKNTKQPCVFTDYVITQTATCQHGEVKEALCVYGCGNVHTITGDKLLNHSFTHYDYQNNATCIDSGTSIATCDYGCGTKHEKIAEVEVVGHRYVYTENNDATVASSKTSVGICEICGHENIGRVDGTRLQYINYINIIITSSKDELSLPRVISASSDVSIIGAMWTDSKGNNINGNPPNIATEQGRTYELKELIIQPDNQHAFIDKLNIYVNGQYFGDRYSINENGTVTLLNIGKL